MLGCFLFIGYNKYYPKTECLDSNTPIGSIYLSELQYNGEFALPHCFGLVGKYALIKDAVKF